MRELFEESLVIVAALLMAYAKLGFVYSVFADVVSVRLHNL